MRLFNYIETEVLLEGFEPLLSTRFIGSTLRGSFGIHFKKIFCLFRSKQCPSCPVKEKYLYYKVFETPAPANNYFKADYLPHPFLFSPHQIELKDASSVKFSFFLFGEATEFFPYFVLVLEKMRESGFTRNRARPAEILIFDNNNKRIYSSRKKDHIEKPVIRTLQLPSSRKVQMLKIDFITPVRIKSEGKDPVFPVTFEVFMKNVFRRLSIINYFFANRKLELNFKEMLEKARKVKLTESYSKTAPIKRRSLRKKQKMEIPGYIGWLIYKGEISPFYPWIKAAEKFHIGKNTSFGFGKYRIEVLA